jgi:aminopeptidase N
MTDADWKLEKSLSREDAYARSAVVLDVTYELVMSFLRGGKDYEGFVRVSFNCDKEHKLFLDFQGRELHWLKINGEEIHEEGVYAEHKIHLNSLKAGHNVVEIRFTNDYRTDGNGLHFYKDPEDEEEYLYTQFEAYSAHKCFPCFD